MTQDHNTALIETPTGALLGVDLFGQRVFRVGYRPSPWQWTPWVYADHGRFDGRWDDPDGIWRTLYVGSSLLACYLELLARFRPDPVLADELAVIVDDSDESAEATAPGRTTAPLVVYESIGLSSSPGGVFRRGRLAHELAHTATKILGPRPPSRATRFRCCRDPNR